MTASFSFRPAKSFAERAGLFVGLVGGTNSGKTFSALRLARGIAGPQGKVAVLDTEGGRTLHLKDDFDFDVKVMDPPFRPAIFAEAAEAAEEAGYDCLLIDSFSMEWVGVLEWQEAELQRMAGDDWKKRERVKMASWIKPKMAHKAMVYSFLQRRIPIIFSIRGEETVKPGANQGDKPEKIFKAVCSQSFPFEITVSFRLASDRKGYIDLSDPKSWKMEGAHQSIFRDGDRLSEEHGAALAAWARGEGVQQPEPPAQQPATDNTQARVDAMLAEIADAQDMQALFGVIDRTLKAREWLEKKRPDLHKQVHDALNARRERLEDEQVPA